MAGWMAGWLLWSLLGTSLIGCAGASIQTIPFTPPHNACVKVVLMDFWTSWVAGACFDAAGHAIPGITTGQGSAPVGLVEAATATAVFNAWAVPMIAH